jgi:hypothetical protein
MSYLIIDIETVPDRTMWTETPDKGDVPKIRLKDSKPPTKGEVEFLRRVIQNLDGDIPVHPEDVEKAVDIEVRANLESEAESATLVRLKAIVEENQPTKKDQVAPPQCQRPIVIGCLHLLDDLSVKRLGAISAAKHGYDPAAQSKDFDERALLCAWADFMAKERPTIVDWNGRTFDMPVLILRSFRHAVPVKWYYAERDYRYRYSDEKHFDLMDSMTDYGAVRNTGFKLDVFAKSIGLPGKYGVDGSMVEPMYMEGKIQEIETYCLTDVIQTAFLFFRQLLVRGRINPDQHRVAAENLLAHVGTEKRFSEFLDLVDQKQVLLAHLG